MAKKQQNSNGCDGTQQNPSLFTRDPVEAQKSKPKWLMLHPENVTPTSIYPQVKHPNNSNNSFLESENILFYATENDLQHIFPHLKIYITSIPTT